MEALIQELTYTLDFVTFIAYFLELNSLAEFEAQGQFATPNMVIHQYHRDSNNHNTVDLPQELDFRKSNNHPPNE